MSITVPIPITLLIPPEKIICAGYPMTEPYLGKANPPTHKLEVEIHSWMVSTMVSPELMVKLKLPIEIKHALRHIAAAFKSQFPNSEEIMNYTYNISTNSYPITCMVWNVQGAGSREFMTTLRKVIRINKPIVFSLVETHMGGIMPTVLLLW